MAGIRIEGNTSGNVAEVDASNNLKVLINNTDTAAPAFRLVGGHGQEVEVTQSGLLEISEELLEFYDPVDGAAVNINLWAQSTSTMTITQASNFININAANSTTANAYAIITSVQPIPLYRSGEIEEVLKFKLSSYPLSNCAAEIGWGAVATNVAPTDGLFLRFSSAGALQAVMNFGGSETVTAFSGATAAAFTANVLYKLELLIGYNEVHLELSNAATGELLEEVIIEAPAGQPCVTASTRLNIAARVYNTAAVPATSPTLSISGITAAFSNAGANDRPWQTTMAQMGRGQYQSPVTTFAQTANHANSTSPTSATLSNTAAGYTTLGGRFQFAAVAGAATDYALFAYQVPAGFQFIITGVRIDSIITGAAIATTATVLDWGLGINASAVSLATADGAGTWAPRRIPLGVQGYPLVAPNGPKQIGESGEVIDVTFGTPLVVDGGRYVHVILQIPVGSATASQVIRGNVMFNGYFE